MKDRYRLIGNDLIIDTFADNTSNQFKKGYLLPYPFEDEDVKWNDYVAKIKNEEDLAAAKIKEQEEAEVKVNDFMFKNKKISWNINILYLLIL